MAEIQSFLEDEATTPPISVRQAARDMSLEEVVEIFGLQSEVRLLGPREEIYDTPPLLSILAP